MRLLFLAICLIGCGSDDESSPATRKKYEVTAASAAYSDGSGSFTAGLTAEISDSGSVLLSEYKLVASISTEAHPALCDVSSQTADVFARVNFSGLVYGQVYYVRLCVFDSVDGDYSPGFISGFQNIPEKYEVTKIEPDLTCYQSLDECSGPVTMNLTNLADPSATKQKLVLVVSDSGFPDKCDDANSGDLYLNKLKLGTTYYLRGCSFDERTLTYSAGLTQKIQTDPKT